MSKPENSKSAEQGPSGQPAEATAPVDGAPNPFRNGSAWGRRALEGIRQLHRDEDARKEVARRLF
jgi:hypothetical protein